MKTSRFDISGKNCLITGSAGLLGKEHAMALLEVNANLLLTDTNTKKLKILKKKLVKIYPKSKIHIFYMDVTKEKSIKKIINILNKKKIDVNILINNAAIDSKLLNNQDMTNTESFEKLKIKTWNKHLSVGLTGTMLCSKFFGEEMSNNKSGGKIINIASDLSIIAPNHSIYKKGIFKPVMYSVIKHGVIGLTKYISTYWNNKNITCNAISPGAVHNKQSKVFINKLKKLIPLARLAKNDEYRGAVQFLCSDASNYMTGQNLIIDGGRSVW